MAEEANETASPHETSEWRLGNIPASALTQPIKAHTRGSRLLSGLLAINAFFLGTALICGGAFSDVPVGQDAVLISLTVVMVLTIGWMLFYVSYTARQNHAILYKDSHAGPVWLRGGLLLFGACSLLLDTFRIVHVSGFKGCELVIQFLFPSIQIVFILTQSYFLWAHSKDCIQVQQDTTRCGLGISLVCNLTLWMSAVADESIHQTGAQGEKQPDNQSWILRGKYPIAQRINASPRICSFLCSSIYLSWGGKHNPFQTPRVWFTHPIVPGTELQRSVRLITLFTPPAEICGVDGGCFCSTNVFHIFQTAYYYLYPFNIEYSLLASAMLYVMWRNVGRLIDEHQQHRKLKFHFRGMVLGPVLGVAVVFIGLVIFIIYEMEVTDEGRKARALTAYYIFNVAALTLMSISSFIGSFIYRFEERSRNSDKNPMRCLDIGLLLCTAMGQFLISYFSVVATVAVQSLELLNVLNLLFSLLTIVQHVLQNVFIAEGLCRQPFVQEGHPGARSSIRTHSIHTSICNDHEAVSSNLEHTYNIPEEQLPASANRLSCKRRILKEITSFLLLANVIFWIMPAFGARPHFANGLEEKFYGFQMWAAIVNVSLPMGIFYRMHSAACLMEVYFAS
ncbi:proton channel OTOP2-like [Scyliorhinus canicula]|uniref:proton channel OTOP2-like n=1 Tax=Scyliorhinus canicula TaxID=7830 RepID=UPI0018F653F0|nr:proton channel OTOP2-like [Scyliorhinus canicula]